MRNLAIAACVVSVTAGALSLRAAPPAAGLVVHEWGTFLAMNGSDGVTLDGMYHEEHALPGFVHARSRDELRLPTSNMKGETPVVYFYTDAPRRVQVEVGFPRGVWTQWYPQANFVGPSFVQTGSLVHPEKGRIAWSVDVVPPSGVHGVVPATSRDALWNFTRDVDAAYVTPAGNPASLGEWERFIFYRGLGQASLPLQVSATGGARLTCDAGLDEVRHVYLLRVEQGRGAYRYLPSVRCGEQVERVVPAMDEAQPIERFAAAVGDDLAARLVESGLYEKEARAMVNTWRTSYFTSDGIRVLFVLPQSWTERFIPMKISPAPDRLVRVMVGRIELLTRDRERAAEAAIAALASPVAATREAAFSTLQQQGRYVEPIVRHTMETSTDERVMTLARRLLLTDFISEIRSSLTDAADGRPLRQDLVFARAQLASLLRDVGLPDEARQEGEAALVELSKLPEPTMANHDSRHTYRALARANEGAGHDAEALKWYSDFIQFGAGYRGCSNCHSLAGPTSDAFFKDWWAGRRFGELAARTGVAPKLIDAGKEALATSPDSLLARIRLAYLYEGQGDARSAANIWARVAGGAAPQVALAK
jgi:hypothetical protein